MNVSRVLVMVLAALSLQSTYAYNEQEDILADANAYCDYIKDKNSAQSITLKTPDAIARLDNGLTYYNFQRIAITGLSKDLADLAKAHHLDTLIHDECEYYRLNQEAKLQAHFALAAVRQRALQFKLKQIEAVKNKLSSLFDSVQTRVKNHHDTLQHSYGIESALMKLDDSAREIYVELAGMDIPRLPHSNLKELLHKLSIAQEKRQQTLNKIEKQNNWSVRLEAGTQKDLSSGLSQNFQPYFAMLMRYNLGSMASNKRRNRSLGEYLQWQRKQILGTRRQLAQLITAINSIMHADKQRLQFLQDNYQNRYGLSKKLAGINTPKASRLHQTVEVDRLLVEIEIKYLQFTIDALKKLGAVG